MMQVWYCSTMLLAAAVVGTGTRAFHHAGADTLDGFLELDPSLAPSAAEIRASAKAWADRAAATPAEEWDAGLRERLLNISSQGATGARRHLQQLSGGPLAESDMWAFDSSAIRSTDQSELQPLDIADGCQDELASNFGASEHCLYDCAALHAHYFPQLPASAPSACFLYDPNTRTWPNQLMDMRRDKLIWHSFLTPTELSPTGGVSFAVGSELACVNVTVQTEQITATGASTEEEIRCLLPGFHEHNHTVENNHTVTVVGYVQSELHTSAGGTTNFVVGECTDTLIRVHTSNGASDIAWELDDDGHNGPWQFTSPGGAGLHEHESCMFDNNFTLTKLSADPWLGTLEVVSYVPDKTIHIPIDQTWIVQGAVFDGVPIRLDARLKSGDAYVEGGEKGNLSEASLVIRHVRFTNQRATLDKFAQYRQHSIAATDVSLGAALEYVGGWGATLIFEGCVFDHMLATSGGAMYIHGQMDEWARDDTRKNRPQDHTLTMVISNCLFWELTAQWVGGAARIVDVYPLNLIVTNSQFLDSLALVSSAINWALYGGPFDPEQPDNPRYGLVGNSSVSFSGIEVAGSRPPMGFGMSPIMFITFPGHWAMGPGTERPDVQTTIEVEELYCHDNAVSIISCIALETKDSCGGSCFNYTLSDSEIRDGLGTALWAKDAGAASYFQAESHQVVRVRFRTNGVGDATETAVSEGSALYIHARVWARLINISAVGHVASRGGAARLFGEGAFELIGCMFQSNVAWESGGAIYKTGIGPLFIHDSIFAMNNVTRQIQVETDIVVLVFTGSYGSTGFHSPIWKLDGVVPSALDGTCGDDVIYGYSLDGNRTHEYSANSMYAEVVSTTSGPHTLWHGLVMHSGVQGRSWEGGGYIDIVNILPKSTPTVCDSRLRVDCQCSDLAGNLEPCVVRAPGCQTAYNADTTDQDNQGSGVEICPMHSPESPQMIWSKTDFNVPQGQGGALAVSGTSTVEITETIFSNNYAGFGESMSATSVESLKVLSTDFSDVTSNTIFTESVPAYDCSTFPCSPGERCSVAQLSLHCDICSPGQISQDGVDCQTCIPGKEPNAIRTLCVACAEGRYSSGATGGICDPCLAGKISAEDRQTCIECPAGTRGAESTCEPCDAGHFSNEGGAIVCTECEAGKISSEDHITCVACPSGTTRQLGEPSCAACGAGHHPNEDGRCVPCSADGYFSLGGIGSTCAACGNGKQPLPNRTSCKDCPGGTAGTDGICTLCQPGRHASSGEIACSTCPAGMEPTPDRSACQCKIGTYDSNTIGLISCDGLAKPEPSQNEECTACPPCLDCTSRGTVWLKEGWASHGSGSTVFLCPYRSACPAHMLNGSSGGTLSNQGCATGYDQAAPLCAMCAAEYNAYKVGMVCDPCDDGTINVPMLTGFIFMALTVVALVVSGCYEWLLDNGMLTDLRIMIGLYQILGQADAVLRIDFPFPVPELMSVAKLLFLDIRTLLRMDCFELGGFYAKLVTNLFVLPMLAAFGCYVYYLNEKKTIDRMVAEGVTDSSSLRSASLNLQRNLMVGVFVMCESLTPRLRSARLRHLLCVILTETLCVLPTDPMMTTTLFSIPMCRELGSSRYHESDYWVSCDSSSFSLVMVLAVFGVLAVPVGLPLLFFLRMQRKVQDLGGQPNENAAGGAKLAADDADDQSDQYAFLVQDYGRDHWYWEIVSYMRKLCLNGWTVVVGRGTMGQIYFATLTSALFLLWHMRAWPFKVRKHNVMEATCEATLLLMYTTCLLLRNTDDDVWSHEWVSRSGYGWMLVSLFVVICPSPMFYSLWLRATDKNREDPEDAFVNPLGDGGGINETPQSAEQRVRKANLQQRKSKSLAQELSKTQVQLSKAQAQLAVLKPQVQSDAGVAYSLDVRQPSQVSALKDLADDGMVEQETLQKAQQGFSKHVRDQIEDMEAVSTSRELLRAFLNKPDVRLGHHAQAFIDVGGDAMTADDLRFLSEEDVAQVSLAMTKIETRRLQVALESGREEDTGTGAFESEERGK